jgi:hypothetical protein
MEKLMDIGMTSCVRPGVVQETLRSFRENLLGHRPVRLVINVDPVGEELDPLIVVKTAQLYCNKISYRLAPTPNFPLAFHWVWSHISSKYVLHLEDDWELLRPMDLEAMLLKMEQIPDLAIMRFSMFPTGTDTMKNWNKFFTWSGDGFFECPEEIRHRVGFCGHPSIIRREWIEAVRPLMDVERNPEKQIQLCPNGSRMQWELSKWRYGVWAQPNKPPAIKDLGRGWIATSGWRKQGPTGTFTRWERKI